LPFLVAAAHCRDQILSATLTARLLTQSMKLAKAKPTKRFKVRVSDLVEDIEDG
jgi:hypothetical protein